jgi:hypothetical protein
MIEDRRDSAVFQELIAGLAASGLKFRFRARGRSMMPAIRDGEILHVMPADPATIRVADVVLFRDDAGFKAHRVVCKYANIFVTRGDTGIEADGAIRGEQIMGKVVAKECIRTGRVIALHGLGPRLRKFASELKRILSFREGLWTRFSPKACVGSLMALTLLFLFSRTSQAQLGGVALDSVNSQSFVTSTTVCVGNQPATCTFTFNHTTGSVASSNGLLVVGVSMNIRNNTPDSSVTSATYNGTAMTQAANANPGNNLRVQIFYLKNPVSGTKQITLVVHKTGGVGNQIGLEVGAISMYRVNTSFTTLKLVQNNGSSTSATAAFTAVTGIPGPNDGVLDVLAIVAGSPSPTITANTSTIAPLVFEKQQWIGSSGTSGQDVEGSCSTAGGKGSALTMRENIGSSVAWTIAAIDIPALNPTAVKTNAFTAAQSSNGVLLSWETGGEIHNLGFNVYREIGGEKVRVNPSLIAGSALLMHETMEQHAARTYGWIDHSSGAGGLYWLEDVDLNGTRTMHGPVSVESGAAVPTSWVREMTIQELSSTGSVGLPAIPPSQAHVREKVMRPQPSNRTRKIGFQLAEHSAVKILVDHEGWYRVTQPQLIAAGLNPSVEARSLRLFAEGVEQAIRVTGADAGFGPHSAIEFYGTAIDTPYSGQRVYWLTAGGRPGLRIASEAPGTAGPQVQSFMQTLELKPRTTYFAALLRDDTDNFFGPAVTATPAIQSVNISNLAVGEGVLDVALQGVTLEQAHEVIITLNGATLGELRFSNQENARARFTVPAGVFTNGANTITLTALQGDNDISLVDYIDVSFFRTLTAESDLLKFTVPAGHSFAVSGFSRPPTRLLDISNPAQPAEVAFRTASINGSYTLEAISPWSSSAAHRLLALSDTQLSIPAALMQHRASDFHARQSGAEVVMLTAPEFMSEMQPLAALRQSEGKSVALINVDDVYDEFNFGERSPLAIQSFLRNAASNWKDKPQYLILGGDASVDPRNYFGFGFFDFVPTKVVITSELKTASDDWFSDFDGTGFAKIATGRIPARNALDAKLMVDKIIGYAEGQQASWANQSMMVADFDEPGVSFTRAAQSVQKMLPSTMNVTDVFAGALGSGAASQNIIAGINSGQLMVNYNGHGSVEVWGSGLFNNALASGLTNGSKLPVFVLMNCLNGFFHDVYTQSLAESLMLAPNGGAVAVWASSGLTAAEPQFQMDQMLVQTLFAQPSITLGNAVSLAKAGIGDSDVRKTFLLFGDPTMRLKQPQTLQVTPTPPIMPDRGSEPERNLRAPRVREPN